MSDHWDYVKQYALLAGYRLLVLANRAGCEDEFMRSLHDRLVAGLEATIYSIRHIMDLQRELLTEDDPEGMISWQLRGEEEILACRTIVLLNELEIDFDTHEYRVDGCEWHNALSADCDGIEISYPTTVSVSDAEIGSLATIIRGIRRETGIGYQRRARCLRLRLHDERRHEPSLVFRVGLTACRHRACARP